MNIFKRKKHVGPQVVAIRHYSYDQAKMVQWCAENPWYIPGMVSNTPRLLTTYYHFRTKNGPAEVRAKFKDVMMQFLVEQKEMVPINNHGKTEWVEKIGPEHSG